MAAQVAAVRAVSRGPEESPPLPSGDRPGRPRGGGRRRRGPAGEAVGGKRARLSQPLLVGPSPAEPMPPAGLPPAAAAGLFTFSPLSLPQGPPQQERHHHHRHRPAGDSEPGHPAGAKPHKGKRGSTGDGAAGRPSKRGKAAGKGLGLACLRHEGLGVFRRGALWADGGVRCPWGCPPLPSNAFTQERG